MAGWVLWLAVVTVVSYLADTGFLPELQSVRVPVLGASVPSVLLLITTIGLIYRVQARKKSGEKEQLAKRIQELERRLGG